MLRDFIDGYIDAILFTETNDDDEPLQDIYTKEDIAYESLIEIISECVDFYNSNCQLWKDNDDKDAGINFWLTRNGHGAGFWDGDYEKGDLLTENTKPYGGIWSYVGDDGKVYLQ